MSTNTIRPSILDLIPRETFVGSAEPTVAYRLGTAENSTYDLVELFPGVEYPPHYHNKAQGMILFVVGEGTVLLDGEEVTYARGSTFMIEKGVPHGFKPRTPTLFLSIQSPPVKDPVTGEEDLHY